jgi:hypothetical protein
MMNRIFRLLALTTLALGLITANAAAQNVNYILQSPSLAQAQAACQTYGLTMIRTIHAPDTYLVQVSSSVLPQNLSDWVKDDRNVKRLQPS